MEKNKVSIWISAFAAALFAGTVVAGIYDAGLYSQVPLSDVSDANRATYVADAKAAGVDAVWISVVDFFDQRVRLRQRASVLQGQHEDHHS